MKLDFRGKNILITGAAGYLGSIIATKLVNLGHIVTAVDIIKYDKTFRFIFLTQNCLTINLFIS